MKSKRKYMIQKGLNSRMYDKCVALANYEGVEQNNNHHKLNGKPLRRIRPVVKLRTIERSEGRRIIKHWVDTYPHIVKASAVVKDGVIIKWKTGQTTLSDSYFVKALRNSGYEYHENEWIATSSKEHGEIFTKLSKDWYSTFGRFREDIMSA